MRAFILAAGAALAVSACGGNEAAQNVANIDQDLTANSIAANDTTSIDAATGDAANMATEMNIPVDDSLNDSGNDSDSNAAGDSARNSGDNAT
jgi:hypothetical protein